MNKPTRRLFTSALAAGLAFAGTASADASPYAGTWSGTLVAGAVKLRLKLVIEASTATIYSLDQGGSAIPASGLKTDGKLTVEFAIIQARYEATVSGDTLSGTFTQGGQPLPLEFKRGDLFAAAAVAPPKSEPLTLTQDSLNQIRADTHMPAVAAAWARNGGVATVLASGLRSVDAGAAVTPADQWHLGSITKSMTATLVARMIERGGIGWDTTVGEVLGKTVPGMNAAYRTASFRHLLSHHAGLPANAGMGLLSSLPRDDGPDPRSDRLRYVAAALAEAPIAGLGEKMVYSNSGFVTAAAMLEAVFGKPWESLIVAHLFQPLGIASAGFGAPGTPGKLDQPLGHGVDRPDHLVAVEVGPGKPSDNPVALGPAGRVHMSLSDVVLYLNAHMSQPESFLKAGSWKTLHTPPFTGRYAMGWMVGADGQLWHNGSNTVWYAEIAVDPARKAVAAAATNDGVLTQVQPAVAAILKSALVRAQS